MAYLKAKHVKGKKYYQVVEAYREGGQKRERVLIHLGTELNSDNTLLKWWNHLGRPPIPYKPGCPHHVGTPSLATPCETIMGLEKFLIGATAEERDRAAEGLKFLMDQS